MMVKERCKMTMSGIPDDIPEVEYPPEVVSRLDREFDVVKAQLATGELRPMSAAEIAAEFRAKTRGK